MKTSSYDFLLANSTRKQQSMSFNTNLTEITSIYLRPITSFLTTAIQMVFSSFKS